MFSLSAAVMAAYILKGMGQEYTMVPSSSTTPPIEHNLPIMKTKFPSNYHQDAVAVFHSQRIKSEHKAERSDKSSSTIPLPIKARPRRGAYFNSSSSEDLTSTTGMDPDECQASLVAYTEATSMLGFAEQTVPQSVITAMWTSTVLEVTASDPYTTIDGYPHVKGNVTVISSRETVIYDTTTLAASSYNGLPSFLFTVPCSIPKSQCSIMWQSYLQSLGLPTDDIGHATEPQITPMPSNRPRCSIDDISYSCGNGAITTYEDLYHDHENMNCFLEQISVRLLYWPSTTSATNGTLLPWNSSRPITAHYGSYVMTSPTVYIAIATIMGIEMTVATCAPTFSPLGATATSSYSLSLESGTVIVTDVFVSLDPTDVSSIELDGGPSSLVVQSIVQSGYPTQQGRLSPWTGWKVFGMDYAGITQPNAERYFLNLGHSYVPPQYPWSSYIFDDIYAPQLFPNDAVRAVMPDRFSLCDWDYMVLNDPPTALSFGGTIVPSATLPLLLVDPSTTPVATVRVSSMPSASPGSSIPALPTLTETVGTLLEPLVSMTYQTFAFETPESTGASDYAESSVTPSSIRPATILESSRKPSSTADTVGTSISLALSQKTSGHAYTSLQASSTRSLLTQSVDQEWTLKLSTMMKSSSITSTEVLKSLSEPTLAVLTTTQRVTTTMRDLNGPSSISTDSTIISAGSSTKVIIESTSSAAPSAPTVTASTISKNTHGNSHVRDSNIASRSKSVIISSSSTTTITTHTSTTPTRSSPSVDDVGTPSNSSSDKTTTSIEPLSPPAAIFHESSSAAAGPTHADLTIKSTATSRVLPSPLILTIGKSVLTAISVPRSALGASADAGISVDAGVVSVAGTTLSFGGPAMTIAGGGAGGGGGGVISIGTGGVVVGLAPTTSSAATAGSVLTSEGSIGVESFSRVVSSQSVDPARSILPKILTSSVEVEGGPSRVGESIVTVTRTVQGAAGGGLAGLKLAGFVAMVMLMLTL